MSQEFIVLPAVGHGVHFLAPSVEDLQELLSVQRGSNSVIERDPERWEQAFRMSEVGWVAIEQLSMGGKLHLTRLGMRTIEATLAHYKKEAEDARPKGPGVADEPAGESESQPVGTYSGPPAQRGRHPRA